MDEVRQLERECMVFARHLTGGDPTPYVRRKYLAAFTTGNGARLAPCGRFDRSLLALARLHPLLTRIADMYSRVFRADSVVRRRLILLLALLECDAGVIERLDAPTGSGFAGLLAGAVVRGLFSLLLLLAALPVLLPLQLLLGRCRGVEA